MGRFLSRFPGGAAVAALAYCVGASCVGAVSAGAADFVDHLGAAFVRIQPGAYYMGACGPATDKRACPSGDRAEEDATDDQAPQHMVKFPAAVEIAVSPVTAGQFRRFIAARPEAARNRPATSVRGRDGDVAVDVRWDEAQAFVDWLNAVKPPNDAGRYRLLTEAEWEYAARAGGRGRFGWGDAVKPGLCAHCGEAAENDMQVGAYRPNRFGIHDIVGHQWEWTADCWSSGYRGAPDDGGVRQGGADCDRVVRGGWLADFEGGVEPEPVFARNRADPLFRSELLGFRVARTLPGDPRGDKRMEAAERPSAAEHMPPPPLEPGASLQKAGPTVEFIRLMIDELVRSCRSLDGGVDADPVVKRLKPTYRGLPVARWDYLAGGEGERWGFTFAATPAAVAAAIPEAAQPRRFLIETAPGPAMRRLEATEGGTMLSCSFRNPINFD